MADDPPTSPMANESRKRKRTASVEHNTSENAGNDEPEISTEDILDYLDNNVADGLFKISVRPRQRKKQKKEPVASIVDETFGSQLNVEWDISPAQVWERMRKFKKFTIADLSISAGDCVYVKHDTDNLEETPLVLDAEEQWKAMVIETRAVDGGHVHILVAWLNRPEDLPGGRKPWHGRYELIPSNQLDVIDAQSVNGKLSLAKWDDALDERPTQDQYFWRQTYDFAHSRQLSPLKPMCIEEQPNNPDRLVVQCTNPKCSPRPSSTMSRLLASFWPPYKPSQDDQHVLSDVYEQNGWRAELWTSRALAGPPFTKVMLQDSTGK